MRSGDRAHKNPEDTLWKSYLGIILLKSGDRNVELVIARLTQNLAERLHHANNQKRTARNLQFFLQRILVRKERLNDIAPKHADVRAFLPVNLPDEAHVARVV